MCVFVKKHIKYKRFILLSLSDLVPDTRYYNIKFICLRFIDSKDLSYYPGKSEINQKKSCSVLYSLFINKSYIFINPYKFKNDSQILQF